MANDIWQQVYEAEQFLRFIFPGDHKIVELRCLFPTPYPDPKKPIVARGGRFDDLAAMARNAVALQEKNGAIGCYYTLNTLKPSSTHIGSRQINRFTRVTQTCLTTREEDILHRCNLLIDCDSLHPKDVMASDEEHNATFELADQVTIFLRSRGWPEPIRLDSGNGCHLIYAADLPADDENTYYWKNCLRYLSERFTHSLAKIDTSVFNKARISRLPGCLNQKGENTPDRPHRIATVIRFPQERVQVTVGQIMSLAVDHGTGLFDASKIPMKSSTSKSVNLKDDEVNDAVRLLEEYELDCVGVKHDGPKTMYFLSECPMAGYQHKNDDQHTAIIWDPTRESSLGWKCLSDDCNGVYTIADVLHHLEEGTGHKFRDLTEEDYEAMGIDLDEWVEENNRIIDEANRVHPDDNFIPDDDEQDYDDQDEPLTASTPGLTVPVFPPAPTAPPDEAPAPRGSLLSVWCAFDVAFQRTMMGITDPDQRLAMAKWAWDTSAEADTETMRTWMGAVYAAEIERQRTATKPLTFWQKHYFEPDHTIIETVDQFDKTLAEYDAAVEACKAGRFI